MALWRRVRYEAAVEDCRTDASHLEALMGNATHSKGDPTLLIASLSRIRLRLRPSVDSTVRLRART
jgi:hypothetical protein